MKIKISSIIIIALVSGLLGGMAMGYQGVFSKQLSFLVKTPEGEVSMKDSLTAEQIEEKIMSYIREEILGEGGPEVSLTAPTTFQNGVYKLNFKIQDSEFASYATKDGSLLFPEAVEIMTLEQKKDASCKSVSKTQDSKLEAFIVSYCPYGTQMQRIINEVVKNIPELESNIKVRYIGQVQDGKVTSMHGEQEAQENLTQICLREEQSDKYFPYVACFLKEGESESCLTEVEIDKDQLESCKQEESRGIAYAQEDFDLNGTYQVSGSPTLVLNGEVISEFDFGGRTAESIKSLLCCGFEDPFQFCENILTTEEATPGFSETYSSGEAGSGTCE